MFLKFMSKLYFILVIIAIFGIFSCSKEKEYPVVPVIEYKSFINDVTDQKGYLVISFTDGDGDIGLYSDQVFPPFDSTSIYHYNLYINIFEKINGLYKPFVVFNQNTQQNDTIVFKYRIPYIVPVSANGSVKGEFTTKLDVDLMQPYLHSDTVKFEIFIYDRMLHKSNTVTSAELYF